MEEILKLSPAERILLVESIWDTLNPDEIEIPVLHIAESRRRLEAIKRGETSLLSWEEVRARIRSHL